MSTSSAVRHRPAARSEFAERNGRVLERLIRARLLTQDGDNVRLAHEALLRSWPRLRDWVAEERDGLRLHRKLTEAAQAWDELGRDAGASYRGSRLAAAATLAVRKQRSSAVSSTGARPGRSAADRASPETHSPVEDMERARELRRTRRLWLLAAALAALLVAAVVARAAAWNQRQEAVSGELAAQARGGPRRWAACLSTSPTSAVDASKALANPLRPGRRAPSFDATPGLGGTREEVALRTPDGSSVTGACRRRNPSRAFGYFRLVAATNVLAVRLALDHHVTAWVLGALTVPLATGLQGRQTRVEGAR